MANPKLTPEVQAELLATLTRSVVLWTEDIMKGYFDDPNDSMAQQMILEAYAGAISEIALRTPNGRAIIKTFIHELQDRVNKESP